MTNKIFLILFAMVLIVTLGFGCKKEKTPTESKPSVEGEKEITIENICNYFPKELIEEAIGRNIVKTEEALSNGCDYYTDYKEDFFGPGLSGGPHILIALNKEDYEQIKKELSRPGIDNEFVKDSRITVNHYLIKSRVGKVWEVDLFLKEKEYLGIKSNYEAASGEELIKIALKIIEKKIELFSGSKGESQEEANKKTSLPQEDVIRNFTQLISDGKPDSAAKMMKVSDESELQAWAVQFAAMNSFKIINLEKHREEEWTTNRHYYKVIFDVLMKPESRDAPIPYYGWENGENTRWLTLEKIGNVWKISEIATGP